MTPQEKEKYFKVHKRIITEHRRENGKVFYTASVVEDGGSCLWGLIKFRQEYVINESEKSGCYFIKLISDEYRLSSSKYYNSKEDAEQAIENAIDEYIADIRQTVVEEIQYAY